MHACMIAVADPRARLRREHLGQGVARLAISHAPRATTMSKTSCKSWPVDAERVCSTLCRAG